MAELKIIKLDNQELEIVDQTARTTATGAASTAQNALTKVQEIEQLSRVEITYTSGTSTLNITTGTHA